MASGPKTAGLTPGLSLASQMTLGCSPNFFVSASSQENGDKTTYFVRSLQGLEEWIKNSAFRKY